jgi:hypothetical protein
MPREASLFEASKGSVARAYLLLKSNGSPNIPPMWIERARDSRKGVEKDLAKLMKKGNMADYLSMEQWELRYRKECFYRGLRVLLELERNGKSKL